MEKMKWLLQKKNRREGKESRIEMVYPKTPLEEEREMSTLGFLVLEEGARFERVVRERRVCRVYANIYSEWKKIGFLCALSLLFFFPLLLSFSNLFGFVVVLNQVWAVLDRCCVWVHLSCGLFILQTIF